MAASCEPNVRDKLRAVYGAAERAAERAYEIVEEQAEYISESLVGPPSEHLIHMLIRDGGDGHSLEYSSDSDEEADDAWTPETLHSDRYITELHYCLGKGDAMGLAGLLMHLSPKQGEQVQQIYESNFGHSKKFEHLAEGIVKRNLGLMEAVLLGMILPSEWVWARTLYEACCGGFTGFGTDEETLTTVVIASWDTRPQLKHALLQISAWKGKESTLEGLIDNEIENVNFKLILRNLMDTGWWS